MQGSTVGSSIVGSPGKLVVLLKLKILEKTQKFDCHFDRFWVYLHENKMSILAVFAG